MTKKQTNKSYKITVDIDSLLKRVYTKISLLEADILPSVSSTDYPKPIVTAETPNFLKRGEQFSNDLKQKIDTKVAKEIPKQGGAFTDVSKAYSKESQRDFLTAAYSQTTFFKGFGGGPSGGQTASVNFLYFVSSTITESFVSHLSNYFPIMEVDQSVLEKAEPIKKDNYKFFIESMNEKQTEIYSNIVFLPGVDSGKYFYKINETLYMGIGQKGQYLDFLVNRLGGAQKASHSGAISEFHRNNKAIIKTRVLESLRASGAYEFLSKHPLFNVILETSVVLTDVVNSALVDYLSVTDIMSNKRTGTTGKRLPPVMREWLKDPSKKFYYTIQYMPNKLIIPENIVASIISKLDEAESKYLDLPTLLAPFSLREVIKELGKVHSDGMEKHVGSLFTRSALTLGTIKKKLSEQFTSTGQAEFSDFLMNGYKTEITGLTKTAFYKIMINPKNDQAKFAFTLRTDGYEIEKESNDYEALSFSKEGANLNIPSYSTVPSHLGLAIPRSLHKWILATLKREGTANVTFEDYNNFLTGSVKQSVFSTVWGVEGNKVLKELLSKSFDPKSKDFTAVSLETVLSPEYLNIPKESDIRIYNFNSNMMLKKFVDTYKDDYESTSSVSQFITMNRAFSDTTLGVKKRPIFISNTGITPLILNIFDLKNRKIDELLQNTIVNDRVNYITVEEAKKQLSLSSKESIQSNLNTLYRNAILGYYGDSKTLFIKTAAKRNSSKAEIQFPLDAPDTEDLMSTFERFYGGN